MTKYVRLRSSIRAINSAINSLSDFWREVAAAASSSDPNEARQRVSDGLAAHAEWLGGLEINIFAPTFIDDVNKIKNEFESERERLQDAACYELADRGWYLTWEGRYSDQEGIIELMALGDVDGIEQFVISLVRDSIEPMRQTIARSFPDREPIVNDAFAAHAEGRYALSIPALLAQSDWMSREAIKASIFSTKGGKPATATKFEHRQGQLEAKKKSKPWHLERRLRALRVKEFASMQYDSPFQKPSTAEQIHESALVPVPISRHAVLHGDDSSYASEISSLRCILLASFLARAKEAFLSFEEEEREEEAAENKKRKKEKRAEKGRVQKRKMNRGWCGETCKDAFLSV